MATTLATPVWTIGSWSGNVTDSAGCRWGVAMSAGWYDGPGVRLNHTPLPRYDGAYRSQSYRAERTITLTGWCEAPNKLAAESARNQFLGLLAGGGQTTLTVTDDYSTQTATVELGADPKVRPDGPFSFDWQLVLSAADPRRYGASVSAATGLPSSSGGLDWATGGGLDWSTGGGLNWGSSTSTGQLVMSNVGTADTWVAYTLTGPLTNPALTVPSTGQQLAYTGVLGSTDTLVISTDPLSRSVVLNGVTDRRSYLTSASWWSLPPGATTVVALSASSGTGSVAASWRPAYW